MYLKNQGSSSGAGCNSRPVVKVHDPFVEMVDSVQFRYRQ